MNTKRRRTYECLICHKVYLHKKSVQDHWVGHYKTQDVAYKKWVNTKKGKEWLSRQ